MRLGRALAAAAFVAAALASIDAPAPAQVAASGIAGFDVAAQSIDYNDKSGAFSIPSRFTARNATTDITGDRANGNTRTKMMHVEGNVVVHQSQPPEKSGELASRFGSTPATLTCDKLDIDGNSKLYTATGHVHYTQGDRDLVADRGSLNQTTHQVHLEGNVHGRDGARMLDADVVDYNSVSGEAHARGNVIVRGPATESSSAPAPATSKPPTVTPKPTAT